MLEAVYDIALLVCVITIMFSTGILLEPESFISYFKKERFILTLRVLLANIVIIPSLMFVILFYFSFENSIALVLFLLAVAPSGPIVPSLVYLNRGDMNWSLALLILLTISTFISIPPLLWIANLFIDNLEVKPLSNTYFITRYLLPVFIPLALGIVFKLYAGLWAERLMPITKKLAAYSNSIIVALVLLINQHQLANLQFITSLMLIVFVSICGLIGLVAIYPSANRQQYITAAMTSGLRNFVIVMLLIDILTDDKFALLQLIPVALIPIAFCVITGSYLSRRRKALQTEG